MVPPISVLVPALKIEPTCPSIIAPRSKLSIAARELLEAAVEPPGATTVGVLMV
jgi:hypothetical protein